MELPHSLVEHILMRLPMKSLLRFKVVSKQWRAMMESRYFKECHLKNRQTQDPDILIINPIERYDLPLSQRVENVTRMFMLDSPDLIITLENLCPKREPIPLDNDRRLMLPYTYVICGSCDGMLCYYNHYNCIYVVNPITRWCRSVPQANFQEVALKVMMEKIDWRGVSPISWWNLGFGKDKSTTSTYKLVWLYNSFELGLGNATTCEVFDFNSTDTWRYVAAAPFRIVDNQNPVYFDGSLHWFTDDEDIVETRILSFDLHTEDFHIVSKTPFKTPLVPKMNKHIIMCNLNGRLCVSQKEWPLQEIWSLSNNIKDMMTWEKIYSLNVQTDQDWFAIDYPFFFLTEITICVTPVAVLKKKNKKKKKNSLVLFDARSKNPNLVIYDPELESYDLCYAPDFRVHLLATAITYIPSLISIL